jgi:uncharacterized protein
MSSAPKSTSFVITGPAGDLEAVLDDPRQSVDLDPTRVALVCHPHPLFGGTMTNKVVHILARTFNDFGAPTLRFNFRGVGKSGGAHDDGRGETDDVLAVLNWMRTRWPRADVWLAGFSFGAAMALRASLCGSPPAALVTVAPALRWLNQVSDQVAGAPECPWLIVQGDKDELVDAQAVRSWVKTLARAPELALLPGAEHFFHGRLNDLRDAVRDWLTKHAT